MTELPADILSHLRRIEAVASWGETASETARAMRLFYWKLTGEEAPKPPRYGTAETFSTYVGNELLPALWRAIRSRVNCVCGIGAMGPDGKETPNG